jgi:hypothetical protein
MTVPDGERIARLETHVDIAAEGTRDLTEEVKALRREVALMRVDLANLGHNVRDGMTVGGWVADLIRLSFAAALGAFATWWAASHVGGGH